MRRLSTRSTACAWTGGRLRPDPASNTTPVLVLRFEGQTREAALHHIEAEMMALLLRVRSPTRWSGRRRTGRAVCGLVVMWDGRAESASPWSMWLQQILVADERDFPVPW